MIDSFLFMAQDMPSAAELQQGAEAWWRVIVDNALALTILVIFLSAIIGAVVGLRRKDKCLKLLQRDHISYIEKNGKVMWGDLLVFSQGLEIQFDAPYHTPRGLVKKSILIFPSELEQCVGVFRTAHGLQEDERRRRRRQINRSFNPGAIRKTIRWIRNLFNTLRDAVAKAFGAVVGQVARAKPGSVIQTQQADVQAIGTTLIGKPNAYEPLLERHIGKPVVLRLCPPAGESKTALELPGYLVDYTEHYIAVFNVNHGILETIELIITESVERSGMRIDISEDRVAIHCTGDDLLVVRDLDTGGHAGQLDCVLIRGTCLKLPRKKGHPVRVTVDRTQQVDMVCPRSLASVRFGSQRDTAMSMGRTEEEGIAPVEALREEQDTAGN